MKENKTSLEFLQPCWVCGKIWQRKDSEKWYYFNEILICKCHDGADEWFSGARKLAMERLKSERIQGCHLNAKY